MKLLACAAVVAMAGCAANSRDSFAVEYPNPHCTPFDAEKSFDPLSKAQAAETGERLARKDFSTGCYRLLDFGYPAEGYSKPSKRLFENFGVSIYRVAGCEVTEGLVSGVGAYNLKMSELLNQKYGKDIFKATGYE